MEQRYITICVHIVKDVITIRTDGPDDMSLELMFQNLKYMKDISLSGVIRSPFLLVAQ